MPIFPGLPEPSFKPIATVEEDGYAMSDYHLLNHIGTHVDAPAHQIAGGDTLDDIGLERLVTDAVTIDVSGIGFDGPSADPVDSTTFDLHRIWLGAGRMIIENATNLDQLPERVQVVVAPLKVRGANGG